LIALSSVPQREPDVLSREVDGEVVLVHPVQNKIRVLNPVGARLWEMADGIRALGEISQALAAEYEVDLARAQADVMAFYEDLAQRGVLVLRS
jgi:hypothetical protein